MEKQKRRCFISRKWTKQNLFDKIRKCIFRSLLVYQYFLIYIFCGLTKLMIKMEFYEKELTGTQTTLIAMSRFLKNEIDAELLTRAYHQIITDGYAISSMPSDFYPETLKLTGLGG